MSMHFEIHALRTKLLTMARLTHCAVERSMKSMQRGRGDMRGAVRSENQQMSAMGSWIARHGEALLTAAEGDGADSQFVSAALRMSRALEAAYAAALEIEHENQVKTAAWAGNTREPEAGAHTDEFADERLTGLQMRVCELLFKNQRLRMALMAEGEDRQHELLA